MRRIGIDIGGVIIESDTDSESSMFGENYLQAPEMPGAIETIAHLASLGAEVWIVSKCGPRIQERSLEWLEVHSFFERTGIPRERVRFCRKRNQKAPIAAELGLTTFIDDRIEILESMPTGTELLAFRASDRPSQDPTIIPVESWSAVLTALGQ